ncbi:hypothetical protein D3C72_2448200 [compost metagenome]
MNLQPIPNPKLVPDLISNSFNGEPSFLTTLIDEFVLKSTTNEAFANIFTALLTKK